MLHILYTIVFLYISVFCTINAECTSLPTLPKTFQLKKYAFSWVSEFYAKLDTNTYNFRADVYSIAGDFTAYDVAHSNTVIGSTSTLILSWAQTIRFYDCNNDHIFTIVEYNAWYNLNGINMYYTILDKDSNKIGSIEHVKYITTTIFKFFDTDNNIVLEAQSDFWTWVTTWTITTSDNSNPIADVRLVGLFASYKQAETDREQARANNAQNNNANANSNSIANPYILDQMEKQLHFNITSITQFALGSINPSNHKSSNPDIIHSIEIICIVLGIMIGCIMVWISLPYIAQCLCHLKEKLSDVCCKKKHRYVMIYTNRDDSYGSTELTGV